MLVSKRGDIEVIFRQVSLHEEIKGKLFLHSMPGRYESWEEFCDSLIKAKINQIICLAEPQEIVQKSPSYSNAIQAGAILCPKTDFPIPDYGTPSDREAFFEAVQLVAQHVKSGKKVLIHCAGGIGRTGTFATCVLHCLGFERREAMKLVRAARSGAETPEQASLIEWHGATVEE